MTDLELMQQALDALKVMRPACFAENTLKTADTAITALRDRLAQPKQELVFDCPRCGHCCPQSEQEPVVLMDAPLLLNGQPLYTTPPQRQWVGLTDEEIKSLPSWWPSYNDQRVLLVLIRDIQAKLKEKNT